MSKSKWDGFWAGWATLAMGAFVVSVFSEVGTRTESHVVGFEDIFNVLILLAAWSMGTLMLRDFFGGKR